MIVQHWLTILLLYCAAYGQYMSPTCNVTTHQYTIIDIKSSVAHNAELLNGTLVLSLSDCIQECCGNDWCDLAVFKNNGTSRGNRNCYFVHCGVDENCLLVGQPHFTTVSIKKDDAETNTELTKPPNVEPTNDATTEIPVTITSPDNATTEPADATIEPADATTETSDTTTEPTNVITKPTDATTKPVDATVPTEADHTTTTTTIGAVITIPTVPSNNETSNSTLELSVSQIMKNESALAVSPSVIITSSPTSSSSSTSSNSISSTTSTATATTSTAAVNRIGNDKTADNKKITPTSADISGPEKGPNTDDRRLCGNADCSHSKVAGLAVACLLVVLLLIIVIVVVVKKSWDRHRSKRYKRIDYLIDGMYS